MPQSAEVDPFTNLENMVKRQSAEEETLKNVQKVKSKLLLGSDARSAFFAVLAMKMEAKIDWSEKTAATDGRDLFVNPDWWNSKTNDERCGVLLHEILHCVVKHHCRREGRDMPEWQIATDLAINDIIVGAGYTLPAGVLLPGEGKYKDFPKELFAEEYYVMVKKMKPPKQEKPDGGKGEGQGSGSGDGQGDGEGEGEEEDKSDPGGCGRIKDAGDPAERAAQEAEWDCAVAQAETMSKGRGTLPGNLARMVGEILHPPADWREVLQNFVSQIAKGDFSWSHPNRRFIHQGLYLPGLRSQELGHIVVLVDTSGSTQPFLELFANELDGVLGAYDCEVTIIYHDVPVTKVEEWCSKDGPLKMEAVGGGGTSHVHAFAHIDELERPPIAIIALTDMDTCFPAQPPDAPVLWGVVGGDTRKPPFGDVIHIK